IRATLRLSSPAWFAHPKKTSSTAAGSTAGLRRSNCSITYAPRSSGRTAESAPRNFPTGVRTASMITASIWTTISLHALARGRPCPRLHLERRPARRVPPRRPARQGRGSSVLSGRFHASLPAPAAALRSAAGASGVDGRHALGHLHRRSGAARAHGQELRAELPAAGGSAGQGGDSVRGPRPARNRAALGL